MSEHVHEWDGDFEEVSVWCIECNKPIYPDEILKRLNTAEQLSAEDAVDAANWILETSGGDLDAKICATALRDYAKARSE